MKPYERNIALQVGKLLVSVRHGDAAAISCKEALRSLVELERDTMQETRTRAEEEFNRDIAFNHEEKVNFIRLSLVLHVLDGIRPKEQSRHRREWESEAGVLAKHLLRLEGGPVPITAMEVKDYLISSILKSIFFAEALELLGKWHSDRRKEEKDRKKIEDLEEEMKWRKQELAKANSEASNARIEKRDKLQERDKELASLRRQLAELQAEKETAPCNND